MLFGQSKSWARGRRGVLFGRVIRKYGTQEPTLPTSTTQQRFAFPCPAAGLGDCLSRSHHERSNRERGVRSGSWRGVMAPAKPISLKGGRGAAVPSGVPSAITSPKKASMEPRVQQVVGPGRIETAQKRIPILSSKYTQQTTEQKMQQHCWAFPSAK